MFTVHSFWHKKIAEVNSLSELIKIGFPRESLKSLLNGESYNGYTVDFSSKFMSRLACDIIVKENGTLTIEQIADVLGYDRSYIIKLLASAKRKFRTKLGSLDRGNAMSYR